MRDLCVVFDLDDTLYLERDYIHSGFDAVGKWVGDWLSIPDFADRCATTFEAGRRGIIFDSVLRDCGLDPAPQLIAALVEIYRAHAPAIRMLPDASNTLDTLSRDYPIALITDGPVAAQSRKCEVLGLPALARPLVLTEMFGVDFRKPSLRPFERVADLVKSGKFAYVADNPLKDFQAPRKLGWTTVRIRRPGGLHYHRPNDIVTPQFELPDCVGLPKVLSEV